MLLCLLFVLVLVFIGVDFMKNTTITVPVDLVGMFKNKYSLSLSDFVKLSLVYSLVDKDFIDCLMLIRMNLCKKDSDYNKDFGGFFYGS